MNSRGSPHTAKAAFWRPLATGEVQCGLCHHFCRIPKGKNGFCRTRGNIGGVLYSFNYGYPAAAAADPVEKKPLYHFMPGTATFSIGTLGCNFRCPNCLNWQISQRDASECRLDYMPPEEVIRQAILADCPSVSFTYNEPTIFAEYALDCMKAARKAGLKTIWVSNGYMSDACMDSVLPLLDAINIDLKSMDDRFYRKLCHAEIGPVLKNLERIAAKGPHLEITTLIIPGRSDHPDMLGRMADYIVDKLGRETPWHLSAFIPEISWNMQDELSTPPEVLENAFAIGKKAGLNYIYSGFHRQDTFCPACGTQAIERCRYQTIRHDAKGHCPSCGTRLNIREP